MWIYAEYLIDSYYVSEIICYRKNILNTLKSFAISTVWLSAYQVKIIPETRHAHW
jgi:hypothetical protein